MGFTTDAHCFACGYDTALLLGAGMRTHLTEATWPVLCRKCRAVTTANFKKRPLVCEGCGGEDLTTLDDARAADSAGRVICNWGDLALTEGRYSCPSCGKPELRFGQNPGGHPKILWD